MKKFVGILMVMLLSVTLVACGGVEKQPAIDGESGAKDTTSELANLKNVEEDAAEPTEVPEPTEAPVATEAPKPTEAPVATEAPEIVADNKQPAIDAFNKAVTAYDALVEKINANPDVYPNYVVELMGTMETPLTNCKVILESDTVLTDTDVQGLVDAMNDVYAWVAEVEMSTGGSVTGAGGADVQSLIDMYNMLVDPINAYVDEVNRHVDDFDEELVNTLGEYAQFLSDCQLVFDSGLEITEEDCKSMKYNFDIIWQWVLEVEYDIFG